MSSIQTSGTWCIEPGQGETTTKDIESRLLPGDIVFTSADSFLSNVIAFVSRGAKVVGDWIPTHTELVARYTADQGAITFSAEPRGYLPRRLSRHFLTNKRVEIWRPLLLTPEERARFFNVAFRLSVDDEGYGYAEFMRFGLSFVKPRSGNKQNICSEALLRVYAGTGYPLFPSSDDPERRRPVDVYSKVVKPGTGMRFGLVAIV